MDNKDIIEKEIVQRYLNDIVGSEGLQIALNPPEDQFTDEELAERLDIEVNTVRRTLTKLDQHDLVDYRRKRDKESGWLTYYWHFEYDNIHKKLVEAMEELHELLEQREKYENNNQFYVCENCRRRISFKTATKHHFDCPECSGNVSAIDNERFVNLIQQRREKLEKNLYPDVDFSQD